MALKPVGILVFAAAGLAAPLAVHAQPPTAEIQSAAVYRAGDFTGLGRVNRPMIGFSSVPSALDRPYFRATSQGNGTTRTVIEHRLAGDGLVGQVGYVCVPDGHPLDGHDAGVDTTSRFGRQDELVGGALNYAFK